MLKYIQAKKGNFQIVQVEFQIAQMNVIVHNFGI